MNEPSDLSAEPARVPESISRRFAHSLRVGLSFGLTSGVVTTLGLIVGLAAGTHSRLAVVGGIVTIAVADALSDALGIHISEESENVHSPSEIWVATVSTLVAKLLVAASFLIPVLTLELALAVTVSIVWGGVALTLLSFRLARDRREPWLPVVGEHLIVAALVVVATHLLGSWVAAVFS
jgi:VIT1/CCC1 family predicted Fe2+/Mn2+ transporter